SFDHVAPPFYSGKRKIGDSEPGALPVVGVNRQEVAGDRELEVGPYAYFEEEVGRCLAAGREHVDLGEVEARRGIVGPHDVILAKPVCFAGSIRVAIEHVVARRKTAVDQAADAY